MEIDWAKIIEKPEAKHKVDGNVLLKYRTMTEKLNSEVDSLKKKISDLEELNAKQKAVIDQLQKDSNAQKVTISNLQKEKDDLQENLQAELQEIVAQKENEAKEQVVALKEEAEQGRVKVSQLEDELSSLKASMSDLENQANTSTAKLTDLENQNQTLVAKNDELSSKLGELEAKLQEASDGKTKLDSLQTELSTRDQRISEMTAKIEAMEAQNAKLINDHQTELGNLIQQKAQELEAMKAEFEQKLEEMESEHGMSQEAILKYEKELTTGPIYLHYNGTDFVVVRNKPEQGIALILDRQESRWLMVWDETAGFVERRTAERLARSIAKAGWPLPGGAREGMGFELEMQGDKSVPDRLLRDQHEYMD